MQPRRAGIVLLYALGVLIMVGAVGLSGLESASLDRESAEIVSARMLALDAASSGASYATGYLRYLVHQINLRERGLNGAEYPGTNIEPWCGDRATAVAGAVSADPQEIATDVLDATLGDENGLSSVLQVYRDGY